MASLDREDFRAWLVAKEPDEVVGRSRHPYGCPGAGWLQTQALNQVASVTHTCWALGASGETYSPTHWICQFARALDRRFLNPSSPVTAKQALEVLDSLDVS